MRLVESAVRGRTGGGGARGGGGGAFRGASAGEAGRTPPSAPERGASSAASCAPATRERRIYPDGGTQGDPRRARRRTARVARPDVEPALSRLRGGGQRKGCRAGALCACRVFRSPMVTNSGEGAPCTARARGGSKDAPHSGDNSCARRSDAFCLAACRLACFCAATGALCGGSRRGAAPAGRGCPRGRPGSGGGLACGRAGRGARAHWFGVDGGTQAPPAGAAATVRWRAARRCRATGGERSTGRAESSEHAPGSGGGR